MSPTHPAMCPIDGPEEIDSQQQQDREGEDRVAPVAKPPVIGQCRCQHCRHPQGGPQHLLAKIVPPAVAKIFAPRQPKQPKQHQPCGGQWNPPGNAAHPNGGFHTVDPDRGRAGEGSNSGPDYRARPVGRGGQLSAAPYCGYNIHLNGYRIPTFRVIFGSSVQNTAIHKGCPAYLIFSSRVICLYVYANYFVPFLANHLGEGK